MQEQILILNSQHDHDCNVTERPLNDKGSAVNTENQPGQSEEEDERANSELEPQIELRAE